MDILFLSNNKKEMTFDFEEDSPYYEIMESLSDPTIISWNDQQQLIPRDSREESLMSYTHYFDRAVNFALRHGKVSEYVHTMVTDIIDILDDLEDIQQSLLLFRGVKPWKEFQVGDIFHDPGFMSKSLHPSVASNFVGGGE
jgi:hypothetical protein